MKKIKVESVIFVIGFVALGIGLWQIYPPLSLVIGGLVLMKIAIPGGDR